MTSIVMMMMEKMYEFSSHATETLNFAIAFVIWMLVLFALMLILNNLLLALGIYYVILIAVFIYGYISIKTCEQKEEKP
jgi:hypothetical protein